MGQVKGVILKYFIINIRANKTGIYDKILYEEDKKFVKKYILDALWYPFEQFKRLIIAVVKVEAKGDMRIVQKWGYLYGKMNYESIHKNITEKRSLRLAIASYDLLYKLWFDFGNQRGEIISNNEFNITFEEFDREFKEFYYLASGWIKGFFELYLESKISTKFIEKSWEGDQHTTINLTINS